MTDVLKFFATCPKGMEDLLFKELDGFDWEDRQMAMGAVYFCAPLATAYGLCLWSRIANRVFLQLNDPGQSPPIASELALYSAAAEIPWEDHMDGEATLSVDFIGTNRAINNTQFGAVRVKDAIVDRLRARIGKRPDVDRQQPHLRIQVRLAKDKVQFGLDLGGGSLHQRGYRDEQGAAPLKENLAAGILLRAGWDVLSVTDGRSVADGQSAAGACLADPMCGSGTLLIEAALIFGDRAPGLLRSRRERPWGFERWLQHDPALWQRLVDEAQARAKPLTEVRFWGVDQDPKVLRFAQANAARAGVADSIGFARQAIEHFQLPESLAGRTGLLVCNPPYGERLGELDALQKTYLTLAEVGKTQCPGWQMAVFTGNPQLAKEMRLRPKKINKFFNGALPCELYLYDLLPPEQATLRQERSSVSEADLSDGARMVANRIQKNLRKLAPWLKTAQTDAYRVYDADLPEYAAAVDVYAGQVHVQEYAAPKSVDTGAAARRLRELISAVAHVFEVPPKRVALKTRQRNKGKEQYEKLQASDEFLIVQEGPAKFRVNLWNYLDTGLFLDHRPLRRRLREEAQGKQFLNLFCYTASATVQAALGGASRTVSVDMSHTYLAWAQRNFELNNLNVYRHQCVQADCLKWLQECRQGFDLIMLDPPTFSNSKRMEDVLDVQRDHVALIRRCLDILNPGGRLYFSTNLRQFKLDPQLQALCRVTDISAQTLDPDFSRNAKIHHCFLIEAL